MATISQRAFSSGELAPSLRYRVDQAKYSNGLSRMRNFIIPRTGGAENRQGTQFIGPVKNQSEQVRLIPFILNQDAAYALELSEGYIRFIFEDRYLYDSDLYNGTAPAKSITAITKANPGVVTINSHGWNNGDEITISGVVGMTELNGRNFRVINKTTNTFQLVDVYTGVTVDTSSYTAYVSGGLADRIFTLATTYQQEDLAYIKYSQNATSLNLTHHSYAPREIKLDSANTPNFSIEASIANGSDIADPTNMTNDSGAVGFATNWIVTSIGSDGEESPNSLGGTNTTSSANTPSGGSPIKLNWDDVDDAYQYRVYRKYAADNTFFLLATVPYGTRYTDTGATGTAQPILNTVLNIGIDGADSNPGAVGFFQQRKFYGETLSNPEASYASQTAHFNDFHIRNPVDDASALSFSLAGNKINEIQHFVAMEKIFILSKTTELLCDGDANGVITPTGGINIRPLSYYGSSHLQPVVIGDSFLFVQARQSIVRDFSNEFTSDNYKGNDLTIFSKHFFDGYTLVDFSYQQIPDSTVWAVRNDGIALSLAYIKEQQIVGWSSHDFGGSGVVENVIVLPSSGGDVPYFVVSRFINGNRARYIERIPPAVVVDVKDCVYMDCALSYDGRNTTATTMTLSGGTTWEYTETLVLTSSAPFFSASDVGNVIQLNDVNGDQIRFTIDFYGSSTSVTGKANRTVPVVLRGIAVTDWAKAVDQVGGLQHLEGQPISVLGDGFVVASPNNPAYDLITVSNGVATLDKPYAVIHVGLPYVCDLETLNIDSAQGTIIDRNKNITQVDISVVNSRGLWVGNRPSVNGVPIMDGSSLDKMVELKTRRTENYDDPTFLATDTFKVNIAPNWNSNGRILIRHVDPLPLNIVNIAGGGNLPVGG